jgi:hypothetical protein
MDLLGTIVMPAALTSTLFLILVVSVPGLDIVRDAWTPLLTLLIALFLPSIVIVIASRRFSYGFWLIIYILAMPIWNFIFPLYCTCFFWSNTDGQRLFISMISVGVKLVRRKTTMNPTRTPKVAHLMLLLFRCDVGLIGKRLIGNLNNPMNANRDRDRLECIRR